MRKGENVKCFLREFQGGQSVLMPGAALPSPRRERGIPSGTHVPCVRTVGCNRRKSAADPRPATTVVPFFISEAALETDHDPFQRQISLIHKDMLSMPLQFTSAVFVPDAAAERCFSVLFCDQ